MKFLKHIVAAVGTAILHPTMHVKVYVDENGKLAVIEQ